MNKASSRVWRVDECRPKQIQACKQILYQLLSLGKLIVIDHTGGGKSHILRMLAKMVNGIILVIIPLLALTADQMANVINAIQLHGSFESHYFDNTSRSAITNGIIPRIHKIGYDMSSTMFLFLSPQLIIKNLEILAALLCYHAKQTLHILAINEAHLYAMHGHFPCVAMRILQRLFSIWFPKLVSSIHYYWE